MQTENTYVETDLGNVAPNPRGEYSDEMSYEYLDTVSYMGGSYMCLAELTKTISGIAPAQGKNTDMWQMLTLPGQLTPEAIAMHDDVVNEAKQVETSRAAVELSQQEVEAARADVSQMRQDTQEAAEQAIASRDSAAGYAQSAEASRTAAKESEDNINAQVTRFDTHVAEKTSETESAIIEARRAAVSAVSTKQDDVTQAVIDEGDKQIKNVEDAGTEQVGKAKSAGKSAVSAADAAGVSAVNAVKAQQTASIKAIQEAGENALQNISDGVDKGLSEEGKAADAKATGEAISKLTEDLGNKITKFYASNQGKTHLADSDNGKIMDMMLYGKSEQKQYSGKNLLELSDNQVQSENLKIQINQGIITFSGTVNTEALIREIDSFIVPSDGTYTISTNSSSNRDSPRILFLINDNPQYGSAFNGATKELNAGDVVRLYIRISSVGSYDGVTIKPMIEKGSKVTSYEPYTGGKPSPSPDYPQEIKSVVNPTVKVCGKNLLQPNLKFKDRVKINIKKGTRLTLICKNGVVSHGGNLRLGTADGGVEWFGFDAGAVKQQTLLRNNVVSLEYLFNYEPSESYALYIGDENTYEPYKEQSVQLPYTLNAIPVSSGGNVTIDGQQYIADYVNVERGKVVRKIDKIILTGEEKWEMGFENWETYPYSFRLEGLKKYVLGGNAMNAKYPWYQKRANADLNSMNAPYDKCIAVSDARFSSVDEFTNELKKQNSNGTPLIAYYVTGTPQEENLSLEEIKSLKSLSTYYPVTNISANSEQFDVYTVFNYPISMANGWNYVKQQLNDNRDYIYDMDTQSAEAYVNSEYAVALTELEV